MADQNRSSEGRFRRDYDDEDRRWQRRDDDDDWRRNDRSERSFSRDEGYGGRGGRNFGGRFGSSEREGYFGEYNRDYNQNRNYGSQRCGRGQEYGGYGGDDYGSQRHAGIGHSGLGGQDYGSQRYGGFGGQDYGSQRHAGLGHSGVGEQDYGRRYGGGSQDFGEQRYGGFGGQDYSNPDYGRSYGVQGREGQYGRSGLGMQGPLGGSESGRQGREWQQFGSSSQGSTGGWQRGEHRGKGPKGYTRSDERIREDVCDRLSDDDELDASEITVTVRGGEVTLEGTVPDRRAKQRAEDLAEAVSGVRDVDNKLRKNKGMLQEVGERLTGSQNNERGGHAGSGTKNTPPNASMSR